MMLSEDFEVGPWHINLTWSSHLNLQPVDNKKDRDAGQQVWRNSHIIRFSQIDGAGIVYYPRYFEMLADSFPQQFAMTHPAQFDISFHHPVRLGELLLLETKPSEPNLPEPDLTEPDLTESNVPELNLPEPDSDSDPSETAETDRELTITGKSVGELCFELHRSSLHTTVSACWPLNTNSFVRQVEVRDWMTGAHGRMHFSRCQELTAVLMEEWFTKYLQCPFATTQSSDGVLVPTVKLQTDVQELPSLGDIVQVSLVVLHIGRSSLGLGMSVSRNGKLLVQTRQTIVFVAYLDGQLSSLQIPSHLLPKLDSQLVAAAT